MQLHDWEIWLDVQLSPVLAKWIGEEFQWVVKSAYVLELKALSDEEIFLKARAMGKIILITRDNDFTSILKKHGPPPKIILLRYDNMDNLALFNLIKPTLQQNIRELLQFNKGIVEASYPAL